MMLTEKCCPKPFGLACLFLSGILLLGYSYTTPAVVFEDILVYEHDSDWPQQRDKFHWGVDEEMEPDTAKSATGIGVDQNRDLVYTLVRNEPHVRIFTTEGKLVDSWSPAKVGRVHMLHVEQSGNIWIADNHGHTVTKYSPQGKVLLTLGSFGKAGMDASHFAEPTDISTTADGKSIFISDGYVNKRIVKFDQTGKYLGMWGGKEAGTEDGQFILPHSLTVMANRVYVADREGARVQVFDLDGNFITDWRDIMVPWAIASVGKYILVAGERLADSKTTEAIAKEKVKGGYVDPPVRQDVLVFNEAGEIIKEIALPQGNLYGQVNWLHAIDSDHKGNIFLSDVIGNHVQKWRAGANTGK